MPKTRYSTRKRGKLPRISDFLDKGPRKIDPSIKPNTALLAMLKRKGWRQSDLADKIGRDKSYINHIIRGRKKPDVTAMIQIAQALDCDSRVIFED